MAKKNITKLKQFDWMVNEGVVFKYLLNMGKLSLINYFLTNLIKSEKSKYKWNKMEYETTNI